MISSNLLKVSLVFKIFQKLYKHYKKKMKDIKIKTLEKRIDDFEQYSKMDNLIISALNVQHRTYARTASNMPIDNYTAQEAGT